MRAGKLYHRVTIQQDAGTTQDAQGHVTPSWSTLATRWASVQPLSGRELWQARQLQPDITHRVILRYDPSIATFSAKMRIVHDGRNLYPVEPPRNMDERKIQLEVLCREAK